MSALCRKVGLSRQNFYARHHQRQRRQVDHQFVCDLVKGQRRDHPRMGTRKLQVLIAGDLRAAGVKMGRDRLFEELRQADLLVKRKAVGPRTTQSRHGLGVYSNLIKGRVVSRPNEVWVGDLTYLRTREGFLYLALLTDKRSRKIVGYHCGDTLEAMGCRAALEMALKELPERSKPIHHSDRGCQYCSAEYVGTLQQRGLSISMTEKDHTAENALAERMNGILKSEYKLGEEFATKELGRRCTEQAVRLYNTARPHLALSYEVPAKVHARLA